MEVVEGHLVTLRLLKLNFIDAYLEKFSDQIREHLHVSSREIEKQYLLDRLTKQQAKQTLFYCIFDNQILQLIGAIEIRDPYAYRGQLYCWLHENFWGTGKFSEALKLAAYVYFDITGHMFLNAYVDEINKRSYNALKKVGFADVGFIHGARGMQYELVLRKQ